MTTEVPSAAEPDPSVLLCSSDLVGPCATCQRKTHKYGRGGLPLCQWCMGLARERWGSSMRFRTTSRS
ncbi:hypothetical protein C3492_35475 [Streptomyces sp. Ru62]|uniref:hypothetical protein n=1 Tax=Streptomyces sp. Ru62 TaxID=2080745 RepID=UPI000CDE3923|nr:hypothetical protein [Streptomyces sp. Ru62]POX58836.1 hypothetical protein C3492_35475 [Streptomyces sp. Ru62]